MKEKILVTARSFRKTEGLHQQILLDAGYEVQGTIAGAACDVFAEESSMDSLLLKLDNFIGTPHIGSATLQTTLRMGLMASQNALAVLRGERPAHVVNPLVYDQN